MRQRLLQRFVGDLPRDVLENEATRLRSEHIATADDPGEGPGIGALIGILQDTAKRRDDQGLKRWRKAIEAERRRLLGSKQQLGGGDGRRSTVAEVTRQASSPRRKVTLLFNLARGLEAHHVLEMGTCVGISGSYLAAGMQTRGGGTLHSLEAAGDRAAVARETWRRLDLADADVAVGRFEQTLPPALSVGPFDLIFVDGHHDGDATREYVAMIRAASGPGALLVLDDINWSDDMRTAWERIRADLRDSTTADLQRVGLILLGREDAGLH